MLAGLLACLTLVQALSGCTAHPGQGSVTTEQLPKTQALIPDVPFYPDDRNYCGPASLASVLNFQGANVELEDIANEIFRKDLAGTLSLDMMLYARRQGFDANFHPGGIQDIIRFVDERSPLIVMTAPIARVLGRHFMVVVGYTPESIIVHTNGMPEHHILWAEFLRQWRQTDQWTLFIRPPLSAEKTGQL